MDEDLNTTTFHERTIAVPTGGLFGTTVRLHFWECERCCALVARDGRQQHSTFHAKVGK